jgi:hypothetical protein
MVPLTFENEHSSKRVVARFDVPHVSSDGGTILLKALDGQCGLSERQAPCLGGRRQPGKVQHQLVKLLRQRRFGTACGYADGSNATRLAAHPTHDSLGDHAPITRATLTSQSTLSRPRLQAGSARTVRTASRLLIIALPRPERLAYRNRVPRRHHHNASRGATRGGRPNRRSARWKMEPETAAGEAVTRAVVTRR